MKNTGTKIPCVMRKMTTGLLAVCFSAAMGVASAEGVKYRGIFINDEDWSLRPWAVKHFGKKEQIGVQTYRKVFDLMKSDGLNLLWPAMHEGGYEFSSRPENLALAKEYGITIGTSHCEPILRNNCYIPKSEKGNWSWKNHRDYVEAYWREGVRRGKDNSILWTIGMRGIHDGGMKDGKTKEEKIAIMEDVFAFQKSILPAGAPTLFVPYKEVLPLYNAGLKVPADATIMWVNDNFGYIRRIGGDSKPQGIYWHVSYHGYPHGYLHVCTTPPAFMWYELVAKCWNNGVRDVWMLNVGDVFQSEPILYAYGKMAATPEAWGADVQDKLLAEYVKEKMGVKSAELQHRIVAHLDDYYNLGFIRKPEHMCIHWTESLPPSVKQNLIARYEALLKEELAIEDLLAKSSPKTADEYFRVHGFSVQFLAHAGIIHLTGKDKDYAYSVYNPLYARWDKLEGGKWSGFWPDTVDEHGGKRQKSRVNRWSTLMQWSWNEPDAGKQYHGTPRREYPATAYRADVEEPTWLEPTANKPAKDCGAWTAVKGLGTSAKAFALLPIKPGVGKGASLTYCLAKDGGAYAPAPQNGKTLVIQFLPDYALWPGLGLGVNVAFDDAKPQYVSVPKSDSNIGEKDPVRNRAIQDNFIRVEVPVPAGAKTLTITAVDPGVVIDKVGIRCSVQTADARSMLRKARPIAQTNDNVSAEIKSSPLFRKTLVIIGDSYVQNHQRKVEEGWSYRLAEKYQMSYYNYGRNGNTLILKKPHDAPIIARRYKEMHTPADYVVVVAGHNDACVLNGSALKKYKLPRPTEEEKVKMIADFRTGLATFCDDLKAKYPTAKIVFVTPWDVDRGGFAEILAAEREIVPAKGIALYDAAKDSGILVRDSAFRKQYFQKPSDTAHLNFAGHTKMLEKMEPFFLGLK